MKTKLIAILILPLMFFASVLSHSDDTEIYLNADSVLAGSPLIMLTLDYRPNLASSVCNGYDPTDATSECFGMFWKCNVYEQKVDDDNNPVTDDDGNPVYTDVCAASDSNNNANDGWVPWLPNPDSNQGCTLLRGERGILQRRPDASKSRTVDLALVPVFGQPRQGDDNLMIL